MNDWSTQHRLIEQLFSAGLAAVDPRTTVERTLSFDGTWLKIADRTIEVRGRLVVLAVGKAAGSMALGAIDVLGDRIDAGIALTKDGHFSSPVPGFEYYEARHPLPDQRGIDATRKIIELVSDLKAEDVVIALISGGGSALLEAPVDGISLEDLQQTTDLLLKAGAPIHHLNAVRSVLSQVKGGGLRRTIGEASCVSLILSDVLGSDPQVIASGPTVNSIANASLALDELRRYKLLERVPTSVLDELKTLRIVPTPYSVSKDIWHIIADNRSFLDAIAATATTLGLKPEVAWRDQEGEARDVGSRFVRFANHAQPEFDCLIGGGETTVTVKGPGIGGRNTEFALAAAIELDGLGIRNWTVASLASDGDDGSANAAGAIADPDSVDRGRSLGVSADAHLQDNDSASYFATVGGLVQTGPTGTNVNDLYIALKSN